MAPIYNYALLETAVRRRSGADPQTHARAIAELWSRFSEVAEQNPYAWLPERRSAEELLATAPSNRLVSAPYPKLLTANIGVDQATGLILCSARAAADAGVPADRWVYVWSGAHAYDEWFLTERADLAASPAIRAAGEAALGHAGVSIDDVAHVDLYSCFPSAVQIAANELGLPLDDASRPLTVTGGLTFAGGPGNNYSGHAIATLAGRLRADPEGVGLVTALGWYVTKHACGVYSARPPGQPFRHLDAGQLTVRPPKLEARADYAGTATVEAYTVPFAGDGTPEAAIVAARADDRTRALVRTSDAEVINELLDTDPLGRPATVEGAERLAFADHATT